MNGAITELCANTSKPPINTIMIITGNNHSFLFALKNAYNSFKKDIASLELILKRT